ncbi:hypothetical protein MMC26_002959 [Xylographa opegraphella]|nr:hypothetical protein [Xylographa opegraphella]
MHSLLTLAFLTLHSQAGSAQYFISPPNSDASDPYTAAIGETINAVWQCAYSYINFNVYGPARNGSYPYLALFSTRPHLLAFRTPSSPPLILCPKGNQTNTNSYSFELGQNLVGLSSDGDQGNNTRYWLKIEDVDPSSGDTTGNWFSTEGFFIYLPSTGAASSAIVMPTTLISLASSSPPIPTVTAVRSWSSVSSMSPASTAMATPQSPPLASCTTAAGQSATAAAAAAAAATASQTAAPAPPSSGYTEDQIIALGIGIGLGLPAVLIAILSLWLMCVRGR